MLATHSHHQHHDHEAAPPPYLHPADGMYDGASISGLPPMSSFRNNSFPASDPHHSSSLPKGIYAAGPDHVPPAGYSAASTPVSSPSNWSRLAQPPTTSGSSFVSQPEAGSVHQNLHPIVSPVVNMMIGCMSLLLFCCIFLFCFVLRFVVPHVVQTITPIHTSTRMRCMQSYTRCSRHLLMTDSKKPSIYCEITQRYATSSARDTCTFLFDLSSNDLASHPVLFVHSNMPQA